MEFLLGKVTCRTTSTIHDEKTPEIHPTGAFLETQLEKTLVKTYLYRLPKRVGLMRALRQAVQVRLDERLLQLRL